MIGTPTTTLTVYRQTPSTDPDHDGMLDPWDEDERAAVGGEWAMVSAGVPARVASPAPEGVFEPSARADSSPFAVVNPGTDVRQGDEVVDDLTTVRYRVSSVTDRGGFSGALAHRRIGLSAVSFDAARV